MADEPHILEYLPAKEGAAFAPREQAVLAEINDRIAAKADLAAMVDYLFESTRDLCPGDRVSVAFLADENRRLVANYTRASYEPTLLARGYTEDLRGSSLQRVLQTGQCRIIHDIEAYGRAHPESRSTRILQQEGVGSNLTCPLLVEGRAVGVLFRSAREAHAFSAKDVSLHAAILDRLSQAIEKAYRIQQLDEANQAYTETLSFVTHELKSPVASLVMTANLLAEGAVGKMTDAQYEKVQRIISQGEYMLSLVGEYLNLARIESGSLEFHPRADVDFANDVLARSIDVIHQQLQDRGMTIRTDIPSPCRVECDPSLLGIVLTNLLSNAVKYGREGGEVLVAATLEDGRFDCRVRNEGPGFSPQERKRLFRKFSRLDNPQLQKARGTGVGLYTVWRIVNLHGGRVRAESQPGQWAEFGFHIPQPLENGQGTDAHRNGR